MEQTNKTYISFLPILLLSSYVPSNCLAKTSTQVPSKKVVFSNSESSAYESITVLTHGLEQAHNDTFNYERPASDFIEKSIEELQKDIKNKIVDVEEDNDLYKSFIHYIIEKKSLVYFESAMTRLFEEAGDYNIKIDFIDMILSSNINYFCNWFKRVLLIARDSPNRALSFTANDILGSYGEEFERVN